MFVYTQGARQYELFAYDLIAVRLQLIKECSMLNRSTLNSLAENPRYSGLASTAVELHTLLGYYTGAHALADENDH